jgi:hypothetical protein
MENFLHHGESFPGFQVGHGLKKVAHELLPMLIDRCAIQFDPGALEIVNVNVEEEILAAPEDGILRDAHRFELAEQFGPDTLMLPFIFFYGFFFDS